MFNNILPDQYDVEFKHTVPDADDFTISYNGKEFLVKETADGTTFPSYSDYEDGSQVQYLFTVGGLHFFLYEGENYPDGEGFSWVDTNMFRRKNMSKSMSFAGVTAFHLVKWYRANKFCGACGSKMQHSDKERMMFCPECGNMEYPRISPAIILAVYDGDKLLMSRYLNRPVGSYALIAGFTEIGETLEETAKREAFEETGIHIKNVRYFRNQPWGFSNSLLVGFYAELDGDPTITVQEDELAEARWIPRDEIKVTFDDFSLTNDMIWHFKQNDFEEIIAKNARGEE